MLFRSIATSYAEKGIKFSQLTPADFANVVYSEDLEATAWNILQQIRHLSKCLKTAWKKYITLLGVTKQEVFPRLYERYVIEQGKGTERFFIKSRLQKPTMEKVVEWAKRDIVDMHKKIISRLRPSIELETFNDVSVSFLLKIGARCKCI